MKNLIKLRTGLIMIALVFFFGVTTLSRVWSTKFINIGTGGTAGTYYPLGGALADIWNKNIEGVNVTAQSTNASVANINLMRKKSVEIIFVQNDIAKYAEDGIETFDGKRYSDIRGMAALYPETIQIVTLANTGIRSLSDLSGKRVGVGAPGSGVEVNARHILAAAGLSYNDIKEQYLSFAEVSANLKDGNIDAGFTTAGFPTANIQDIAAQHDLVMIPVTGSIARKLMEQYKFYTPITIPAGTYGESPAVKTVAVKAMLAVRADVPDDLVYNMLKTMYENSATLRAAHTKGSQIVKEKALEGISIKLHPGVNRYFKQNHLNNPLWDVGMKLPRK